MAAIFSPTRDRTERGPHGLATRAGGVSWAALVAAATLGESGFSSVHARIVGEAKLATRPGDAGGARDSLRLVVQSYAKTSLSRSSVPSGRAKPLGSLQRAVTPDELERGVNVEVMHVGPGPGERRPVVVAWVEHGAPDLEFDGLRARPSAGAWYGSAHPSGAGRDAVVVLRRPAA